MNGPCESCHLRPTTHVLRFGDTADGVDSFLVCHRCAEVAEGYYGTSTPFGGDAA